MFECITTHCLQQPLEEQLAKLVPKLSALVGRTDALASPILNAAAKNDDLAEIQALADHIRAQFKRVIVVGAGGSGLSGRTLCCLQSAFITPALHFLENIDPHAMNDVMTHLNADETCFIVISKSGSTVETLSQFYVLLEHMTRALGAKKAAEHFIIITTPTAGNPMLESANERGIHVVAHASDIGGRFSIFTNVGLLPAAIAGLDIAALREGAQKVLSNMAAATSPADFAPAVGAAIASANIAAGKNITVMLPYCERLSGFSSWYRQIWAESLGKNGKGSTPIRAVGTTDQHSQLQLYLDGPKDKIFHLIFQNRAGKGQKINAPQRADLDYIHGKTTGDIMAAEQKATFETLVESGAPVRLFMLEHLGEKEMGALLMHFILEVMLTAHLLCINAFDQPAVEEGKILARDYLLSGNL
ncbi:MAG: glucose-6-phosphate isomerase [Alphaproteobacteria bacterium]|nr:glucose-6-phosphate isomerase [Alphaproteobacteria bacterium]